MLWMSCAKLKINEYRIEDKIFGLNEKWMRNLIGKKIVVGQVELQLALK